ncbi:hypothetical protein ED28_14630 [[Pantoea] beijingensis]|uniref:CopG-like ribbon-helix-helix domain-containing protein n=1 Tax=[Pantoea] beijingensis TaxID=1324864 RepID=A0A443IB94_9GAMM|nr:hypothetical protein [[Pantoea] beijingensis]RWR01354.1 hypothetical protein ED28_14630 [[Pantoea] beijingensis]
MALSIKLPDHVYSGLLAEAKRQGTTVPRLIRDVLSAVATRFDNGLPLPGMGKHHEGENNSEQAEQR